MKTISFFSAISGLLLLAVSVSYATITADPQLYPLQKKKSAIFQLPQGEEKKVLVKIKDDMENTLMEVEVDAEAYDRKLFNFYRLKDGNYFMDIFHNGIVTRKELSVRWDGIKVVNVTKMDSEPISNSFFHYWF
ncbi:hypothetical protein [Catalinimonas niigatensis]|uniref:hypothetical protein n=1 Tax=Catalinimonas niigatensis TaxID=1397264 RepID=UPI002665C4DD|nr:hypothetical protein [Catalinimonas niigatensis]WPP52030.1 hypothetical protein PZB72_06510 [Catalinimonas niigatensis]